MNTLHDETTSYEAARTIWQKLDRLRIPEAYSVLDDVEMAIITRRLPSNDSMVSSIMRSLNGMATGHALEATRRVRQAIKFEATLAAVMRGAAFPVSLVGEAHLVIREDAARRVA
ncbi:hypothetical protein [Micavibrio aeruginosavorus]|uniref:hypothetical protein n=1 Tax=Micavibrio aeruginosavorus TaxID=349221 RepID=UPI003F4A8609